MTAAKTLRALICAAVLTTPPAAHAADILHVCADPANLPFTNEAEEGFSNRIAERLAAEMGRTLRYHWRELGVGFLRLTLQAGACDVVMDYAADDWRVLNTAPYYRSSFVIAVRRGGDLEGVEALSDPRLEGRRIGVVAGGPPAAHLARLGLIGDARPYRLTVDRRFESPALAMLGDLDAGEIDAAILWGPLAGGDIAASASLTATMLTGGELPPPLVYDMTIAVRLGDEALKAELEAALASAREDIDAILQDAHVPQLPLPPSDAAVR